MNKTPFSIGGVDLAQHADDDFEAKPPLSDVGGEQRAVFTEFFGGVITVQFAGAFPKPIDWSGTFYGADAIERFQKVDKLRQEPKPIVLQYGELSWFGILREFKVDIENIHEVNYHAVFKPLEADGQGGMVAPDLDNASQLAQAFNIAQEQVTSATSQYQFSQPVQQSVTNLQGAVTQAIQQSGQNLSSVPLGTINLLKGQVSQVQQQLAPLLLSNDPFVTSAASVLNTTLGVITNTLDRAVQPLQELDVMNPNLPQLAAQYYGDATKWEQIVHANSSVLPMDPMPIGTFKIVIPVDSMLAATGVTTWL